MNWPGILVAALAVTVAGCKADEERSDPPAKVEWPELSCDELVPSYCIFPWPNNVYTVAEDGSPTGRRVVLDGTSLPLDKDGEPNEMARWARADGFSRSGSILTQMPGATEVGLALADRIQRSLEDDSPTVIIDAETGEHVLHIAELDYSSDDREQQTLLLTPGMSLEPATRYIVAIRNVVDESGDPLPPSAAFEALRDLTDYDDDPSVEQRRPLYTDIFQRLADAGVERDDLQVAWDFTTNSVENVTGPMLKMRDEALAMGDIPYTVDTVDTDFNPDDIAFRVRGKMTVPTYLVAEKWPGLLSRDDAGMPTQVGTREVRFEALIPQSALNEPAALLQYGHGLLGGREQIESPHLLTFINEYNYVLFAVDWIGMASDDQSQIANVLNEGWFHDIGIMMDRLHQGTLEQLLAMRMMSTSFAADPDYGGYIDASRRHYYGLSQGGILGGVYMGLTTDVERGLLGVMGQPFNLILLRSVDFELFFEIVRSTWPDPRDVHIMLSLVQQLWDRVEPTGYTAHLRDDPLPGTPTHEVLMRAALGDHQVTPLSARVMARSIGATHLDTGVGEIFGLDSATGAVTGSAYVEYDFGLPSDPVCNVPQMLCEDPHGTLRQLDEARQQLDHFLRTGEAKDFCDGACEFGNMSGCSGGESNDAVCEP
jgi:hypothetical protein